MLLLDFALFFLVLRTLAGVSQLGDESCGLRPLCCFAPFYAGMDSNNIAVLAVECSLLALGTDYRRRDTLTALLPALSIAFKPQIGFCFLVYFVWSRRWRVAGVAVTVVGAATVLSLLRMYWAHVMWVSN